MLIHFIGAINGNKDDYKFIIRLLEQFGHDILTYHAIERDMEDIKRESLNESKLMVQKINHWLNTADVVVFEVTKPDTSIGVEITRALNFGKSVIILYKDNSESIPHGLKGDESLSLQLVPYNSTNLRAQLKIALSFSSQLQSIRFNMYLPPRINSYLNKISCEKNISKASYIRSLIFNDINKNQL